MAAHQALPSLGFSRQEHWSGLPFLSPIHKSEKWKWSRSVMSNLYRPHRLQPNRLLHPWHFPGKSTGVDFHCLLRRVSREYIKLQHNLLKVSLSFHHYWETCMQVKKQQLELDMKKWAGSKLGKEYIKAVHCHSAYLTYMQSTSWEMLDCTGICMLHWQ